MFTISFYRYQEESRNRTITDKQNAHAFKEVDDSKLSEVTKCKDIFTSSTNGIYIIDILENAVLAVQSTFTLVYCVIYTCFTCSVNFLVIFSVAHQAIRFPRKDLFTILRTFFFI